MKTKEAIFELITLNPVFHLATEENGKPYVRGMLLYKVDENGLLFHTGTYKDVYRHLVNNPSVELCFNVGKTGEQIRISGEVTLENDPTLLDEIYQHPTRGFLRAYGEGIKDVVAVFRLSAGKITTWTMAQNLEPNQYLDF